MGGASTLDTVGGHRCDQASGQRRSGASGEGGRPLVFTPEFPGVGAEDSRIRTANIVCQPPVPI